MSQNKANDQVVANAQRVIRRLQMEDDIHQAEKSELQHKLVLEEHYTAGVEVQLLESQHEVEEIQGVLEDVQEELADWKRRAKRYKQERTGLRIKLTAIEKELKARLVHTHWHFPINEY